MSLYTIDTETCGLHGMPVLLQYAIDNGSPQIHDIWTTPFHDTLLLIEEMCQHDVLGFNLSFDWFQLCKIYTTFSLYSDLSDYPENHIDELAILEEQARFSDICIKPKRACDIMLHSRRGPYQSLMKREPIRVRRVPTAIAFQLAEELERCVKFDDIYFAKSKDRKAPKWKVYDSRRDGIVNPDFKDIVLEFKASGALKVLYQHAFKEKPRHSYREIEVNRKLWPVELGYAPFALAVCPDFPITGSWAARKKTTKSKLGFAWPGVIREHIQHWTQNKEAREYASDDIIFTRRLWKEHFGSPEPGDVDSELTCCVAACRWRGYAVDIEKLTSLKQMAEYKAQKAPTAPKQAKIYIMQALNDVEKAGIAANSGGSTKKAVLEELTTWEDDDGNEHPAAKRAKEVLEARGGKKEIEVLDKLITARRFHAAFNVIGALSSRMSGSEGLNAQGINHKHYFRAAFTLADPDFTLCIGDFKAFEVTLALRVFADPKLEGLVRAGKKVHGLMGMLLFPGTTYEQILASEGKDPDMYDIGKKGFFLKVYFGNAYTFNHKLGRPMEIAEAADRGFNREYSGVKTFQDSVVARFTALTQPGGIGTKVEWRNPAEYAETFLGFRRYFTLENKVIRVLYNLAQNPPKWLREAKIRVMRRERMQTAGGAAQSALYGAAFGIQSANIRAAGNHYVQSPGAEITKATQYAIWTIQPNGVGKWIVQPMNIHDEIAAPTRPGYEELVESKVNETVARYKQQVPLLAIDWVSGAQNWAEKKKVKAADASNESPAERTQLTA